MVKYLVRFWLGISCGGDQGLEVENYDRLPEFSDFPPIRRPPRDVGPGLGSSWVVLGRIGST
jgi:hypothetical protein